MFVLKQTYKRKNIQKKLQMHPSHAHHPPPPYHSRKTVDEPIYIISITWRLNIMLKLVACVQGLSMVNMSWVVSLLSFHQVLPLHVGMSCLLSSFSYLNAESCLTMYNVAGYHHSPRKISTGQSIASLLGHPATKYKIHDISEYFTQSRLQNTKLSTYFILSIQIQSTCHCK